MNDIYSLGNDDVNQIGSIERTTQPSSSVSTVSVSYETFDEQLAQLSMMTNEGQSWTLPIRLIRSFEHRNIRFMVVRNIDPAGQMTGKELKELIRKQLPSETLPPPFKTFAFDTLKIEHFPHQAKTNELAIRLDGDDHLIIEDDKHLSEYGIINETEICFFKMSDYQTYRENPTLKLD